MVGLICSKVQRRCYLGRLPHPWVGDVLPHPRLASSPARLGYEFVLPLWSVTDSILVKLTGDEDPRKGDIRLASATSHMRACLKSDPGTGRDE